MKLFGSVSLSSLLYADDLAIIADSAENLQVMVNELYAWCRKWRIRVSIKKPRWCILEQRVKIEVHMNLCMYREITYCR